MSPVSSPIDIAQAREERRARTHSDLCRARTSPEEERTRIRQHVALEYLDVAEAIAHRFRSAHADPLDVRQVAYMGLLKAVARFEPDRGEDIVAFAVPTISGEIKRYLRDSTWMVRPPRAVQEHSLEVSRQVSDLGQSLGRDPDMTDLERETRLSREEVTEALTCLGGRRPLSLDAPTGDAWGSSLGETIARDDEEFSLTELRVSLDAACRQLATRDREVVRMRFVEEMTQSEIAARIGVTQMQVSRILTRVLGTLRERLTPDLMAA